MTARTTQPRLSKGPLGERGRHLQERLGRSAACGYHAPGRSAGMAARLMVMSCRDGEGGTPTRQLPTTRGLVEEPVAVHAVGNAVADMRSLPAGLGQTQRLVDRGAGGNRCQSACPCGTRRLPPTRLTNNPLTPNFGARPQAPPRESRGGARAMDQRRDYCGIPQPPRGGMPCVRSTVPPGGR